MQAMSNQATDFAEYLRPVRTRWWLVAVIALIAAVGTYRYYAGKPTYYTASTNLYMDPNSSSSFGGSGSGLLNPDFLANQAILLRTAPVAMEAAKELGYRGDPSVLLASVAAAPQSGTDFLTISAQASNAVDAGRIANAFAQGYITVQERNARSSVAQQINAQQQQLAVIPDDPAHAEERNQIAASVAQLKLQSSLPTAPATQVRPAGLGAPTASDPTTHAIYGLILGLIIGVALALALDALDRRVKRIGDVESCYGYPVVAKVPWAPPQVCEANPREGLKPPLAEAFRALRMSLELQAIGRSNGNGPAAGHNGRSGTLKTILIASAVPGEGKSMVARNLALAYLEAGKRVVVIDGDLRSPDLTDSFGVERLPGLPEILTRTATLAESLQTVEVDDDRLAAIASLRTKIYDEEMMTVSVSRSRSDGPIFAGADRRGAPTFEVPDDLASHPHLAVLPSAPPAWNPAPVFGTGEFKSLLGELRARYDAIIIDSSPLTVVSDAAALVPLVDGVIIVSRLKRSPISAGRELKTMFDRIPHANVLGIAANDVRERTGTYVYSRAYEANA